MFRFDYKKKGFVAITFVNCVRLNLKLFFNENLNSAKIKAYFCYCCVFPECFIDMNMVKSKDNEHN